MEFNSKLNIAPEILLNADGSSPYCDIWSLGIIIIQLFTGITNYLYEEHIDGKDDEAKSKFLAKLAKKVTPSIVDQMDNSSQILPLKAIVIGMLRFDCNERPNIFKVADNLNQYFTRQKIEKYHIKYEKSQKEDFDKFFKID